MITENVPSRVLYADLDTSFVNLWGLLRYLSQQSFIGRVHVELTDYSADVFLDGRETPLVHEIDRAAGTDVVEEAALHRLVLRVRESPGKISVYEGAREAVAPQPGSATAFESTPAATPETMRSSGATDDDEAATETTLVRESTPVDTNRMIKLSSDLVAAVERAATSQSVDFTAIFQQARVALGDDYPFLDPMSGSLQYANSAIVMNGDKIPEGFVTGLSEALRRVVDQIAAGDRARRARERVALELARVARKDGEALTASGFKDQLDLIAGTKVI
ncbi:MAG TPA: hypothetical protein VN696_00390 [Pyrinomonadaceae bacterium]|nr:hypothetical protein [Pyrinomonadaceae bacterium]